MKLLFWFDATRPKTLLASIAPVLIGLAVSYSDNNMSIPRPFVAVLTIVCALLIQIGSNISNDLFDFINGADNADRVGPNRAAQSGLLSEKELARGIIIVFALAVLIGSYLFFISLSPAIIAIGIFSIAMAILYTGGPYPLGYFGLGDVLVFIFFGIIPVQGTYLLQLDAWSYSGLIYGILIGFVATSILVVNNLRDIDTDKKAGKYTLAVIFGKRFAMAEYILLLSASCIGLSYIAYLADRVIMYFAICALAPITCILIWGIITKTGTELNKLLVATSLYCFIYSILISLVVIVR